MLVMLGIVVGLGVVATVVCTILLNHHNDNK
jgi:hypothetical protein